MRLMIIAAPALAAALLGLAACHSKPVDPTANDADLVDAPVCDAADLTLAYVGESEDADQRTYTFAYVNSSKRPCTLRGFPAVDFKRPHGTTTAPISTKHADVAPQRDPIRPGKRLLFEVISAKKGDTCLTGLNLSASAPLDAAKSVRVTEGLNLCDDIHLTPVHRDIAAKVVVVR
jgi:hypothetical protein